MEATPKNIDLEVIRESLLKCEGVVDLHDLHVWELTASKMVMTCHLISDTPVKSLNSAQ